MATLRRALLNLLGGGKALKADAPDFDERAAKLYADIGRSDGHADVSRTGLYSFLVRHTEVHICSRVHVGRCPLGGPLPTSSSASFKQPRVRPEGGPVEKCMHATWA